VALNWLHRVGRPKPHHPRPRAQKPGRPRHSRPRLEALEGRQLPSVFTVTNTDDSGPGSLRQAILDANANPGLDTIAFNIGRGGVQTIAPRSALPSVRDSAVIDGTTQPGYAGRPLIVLDGSGAGANVNGLTIAVGGNSTVKGLVINGFSLNGIDLLAGGTVLQGNYLGTDATGTRALGNGFHGVFIDHSPNNTVGGAGAGNLIAGNHGDGVYIIGTNGTAPGNVVRGNDIGTDVTGTHALGNTLGVVLDSTSDSTIGGTAPGAGNLVSGNRGPGVYLFGLGSARNVVQGNTIGTDASGTQALGNQTDGVGLDLQANNNLIGGTAAGAGNVIAGNQNAGVSVSAQNGGMGNQVQGNTIGTDVTGTRALGNQTGVLLQQGTIDCTIGGTAGGARNLISGNRGDGVRILGGGSFMTTGHVVQGNYIGTDVSGTAALGNGAGITLTGFGVNRNTIGGTAAGAGNLISGNAAAGISLSQLAGASTVQGNFIGTDVSGTRVLGNGSVGVDVAGSFTDTIGGTLAGAGNLISGNSVGVSVGGDAANNLVQGNFIGTDVRGTAPLANRANGVVLSGASANNTIGGVAPGAHNLLSGNGGDGIVVSAGGNAVQGNFIGTDVSGAFALANAGSGVSVSGSNNVIGGTAAGARNLLSGNAAAGVAIASGGGNLVQGNFVGTDVTGARALGNRDVGVAVTGGSNNLVGGTPAAARNVISGNAHSGVVVAGANTVQGNFIGTDVTGTSPLGNENGAESGGAGALVGGTGAGAGNLIAGNTNYGVLVTNRDGLVQGNRIGTDVTGLRALGNGTGVGIVLGTANTIGGTAAGARNVISGNQGDGIFITESTGNLIQGNFIGTDVTGAAALGNGGDGLGISGGISRDMIGGPAPGAGNVLSGNGRDGVSMGANAGIVQGNFIGTDVTGTAALGNGRYGLYIVGQQATVGGPQAGAGNVIAGNGASGIQLENGGGHVVQGNFIGTDATGAVALGNGVDGIRLVNTAQNRIGGTAAGAGNLISGNAQDGVEIAFGASRANLIEGNRIGTDGTGARPLGNGEGVLIRFGAGDNTVGGTAPGAGNLISGNAGNGITVGGGDVSANAIQGNSIGTDLAGAAALANGGDGVHLSNTPNNTVGGTAAGAGNLISGNAGAGVAIVFSDSRNNFVQGNRIGTDFAGAAALGNGVGVLLSDSVAGTVGGTAPGTGNLISGNVGAGIEMLNSARQNRVQGNRIGTDATGAGALGNGGDGITMQNSSNNTVGGTAAGAANTIAFNAGDGVRVDGGSGDAILRNSIFGHDGGLGIELAHGGNHNQQFPLLTSAVTDGVTTTISGALTSAPDTTFTVEIFVNRACNPSGYGEGERFFASLTVTTDADGHAAFTLTVAVPVDPGAFISATATDPGNNTSPFSACVTVTAPEGPGPCALLLRVREVAHDVDVVDHDQALADHALQGRQQRADALGQVHDVDAHRQVLAQLQQAGGV
jgi:hypothetical protein